MGKNGSSFPEFDGSAYHSTISGLSNGVHNLTIHVQASEQLIHYWGHSTITFTIAEPEPFPTSQLVAASAVASAAAIALGLVAYPTKHKKKKTQK